MGRKSSLEPKKLTEKQQTFVDAKMVGKTDHAAAKEAGYSNASLISKSETIRAEITAARRWLRDTTQITRLDCIEGLIDGIEIARHMSDSGNVIRGWVEVAKILGHAAPEVKVRNITVNQMVLRSKFESMPLEELLAISEGKTFNGNAQEVQ